MELNKEESANAKVANRLKNFKPSTGPDEETKRAGEDKRAMQQKHAAKLRRGIRRKTNNEEDQ